MLGGQGTVHEVTSAEAAGLECNAAKLSVTGVRFWPATARDAPPERVNPVAASRRYSNRPTL